MSYEEEDTCHMRRRIHAYEEEEEDEDGALARIAVHQELVVVS